MAKKRRSTTSAAWGAPPPSTSMPGCRLWRWYWAHRWGRQGLSADLGSHGGSREHRATERAAFSFNCGPLSPDTERVSYRPRALRRQTHQLCWFYLPLTIPAMPTSEWERILYPDFTSTRIMRSVEREMWGGEGAGSMTFGQAY